MDVAGKKITVVGIGESGRPAALFLKKKGANVYATDAGNSKEVKACARQLKTKGINVETGKHTKEFINNSRLMVISPGVSDDSLPVKVAKKAKIDIISEIELAFRFCKGRVIAITGTNGKSTTVTLTAQILKDAGKDVILCGNIGNAFTNHIDNISSDTIVVLEVSSFQLEHIKSFKPHIAVILNISQNHLDRHSDFDDYFAAKKRIYKYQTKGDYAILNYDDINLRKLAGKTKSKVLFFSKKCVVKGAYADDKRLFLNVKEKQPIANIEAFNLKQPHNIENFLAASLCAYLCGVIPQTIKETIAGFKGLEHRLQPVATVRGVSFIDDSKATTVDATRAALESLQNNIILIAGGRDKESDFSLIRKEIEKRVKAVILIGEAKKKIAQALSGSTRIEQAEDMDGAVDIADRIAKSGDRVLLSPMCASFDMFKDYKDRGEAFKRAVEKLK